MKFNGHEISLPVLIATAVAVGSLLTWVGTIAADNADTKRRVDTVEKRQSEDRTEARQEQREIKQDVKDVKQEVQQIRILLESMKREGRSR